MNRVPAFGRRGSSQRPRSQANERLTVGSVPQRSHRNRPARSSSIPALLERQDYTVVAWYPSLYAPRTGGAYDSHYRTAGIAGRTRRRGCVAATRGARATGDDAGRSEAKEGLMEKGFAERFAKE